jgi:hypothetical protein
VAGVARAPASAPAEPEESKIVSEYLWHVATSTRRSIPPSVTTPGGAHGQLGWAPDDSMLLAGEQNAIRLWHTRESGRQRGEVVLRTKGAHWRISWQP